MKLGDCTCAETGMHLCERHGLKAKEQDQTRKANLGRSRPLARQSDKQKLIEARLAGIKEAFIFLTSRTPEGLHCWNCGRKCRADELDLHHLRPRGSGGEHSARNTELWGRDCCHRPRHGEPMWGEA